MFWKYIENIEKQFLIGKLFIRYILVDSLPVRQGGGIYAYQKDEPCEA